MDRKSYYFDRLYPFQDEALRVIADLARRLCAASRVDWEAVMWIEPPACETFLAELQTLGEGLIVLPN